MVSSFNHLAFNLVERVPIPPHYFNLNPIGLVRGPVFTHYGRLGLKPHLLPLPPCKTGLNDGWVNSPHGAEGEMRSALRICIGFLEDADGSHEICGGAVYRDFVLGDWPGIQLDTVIVRPVKCTNFSVGPLGRPSGVLV